MSEIYVILCHRRRRVRYFLNMIYDYKIPSNLCIYA